MEMDRTAMLRALARRDSPFDVLIVGGGATGLGCAIDAAARGYRTALLERHDFAKGTSSRSTKLIHGGIRYLRQGRVRLVLQALEERGYLLENAPHLVHSRPFIVPFYGRWEGAFYGIGLKLYDRLAGRSGIGRCRRLSRKETLERIPNLEPDGLRGSVLYFDGQFDDARLAVNMAQTAAEHGAVVLNYVEVNGLIREGSRVAGVVGRDLESGEDLAVRASVVINATGVWTDGLRRLDDTEASPMITVSRGSHIVLDRSFLPGEHALMVPKTDDGRVLFAIPWHGQVIVGTTDMPVRTADPEPIPRDDEIDYLLRHAGRYLSRRPTRDDVRSVFAGLRPLVSSEAGPDDTARLAREFVLDVSASGLVTITGGKWTTYRKMAEDAVDRAATVAGLPERECSTRQLRIHGARDLTDSGDLSSYGSDAPALRELIESDPAHALPIVAGYPFLAGQVVWAARYEMSRTVEDVLARRIRLLSLDVCAAVAAAPAVAEILARELGRDAHWRDEQVREFREMAAGYALQA
jgi:glycerol-3-phosphate dehydrogenase